MRVLIVSDIHANLRALQAVSHAVGEFDRVICAGDTVNYGPMPGGCIDWLQDHDAVAVRGNHDHAVAFDADPKAAPTKQPLALAMREWTRGQLAPSDLGWLLMRPRQARFELDGARFLVLHATPVDPLYDYRLKPDVSDGLLDELTDGADADVLIVGHTHLPLLRVHRDMQIVNPGSVGQPLDGDPRAAYALWEDGRITLLRTAYDQESVLRQLHHLPLPTAHRDALCRTLQFGRMDDSPQRAGEAAGIHP